MRVGEDDTADGMRERNRTWFCVTRLGLRSTGFGIVRQQGELDNSGNEGICR